MKTVLIVATILACHVQYVCADSLAALFRESAQDLASHSVYSDRSTFTVPFSASQSISDFGTTSSGVYSLTSDRLEATFINVRSDNGQSSAASLGSLYFSLDQDNTYQISGGYEVHDNVGNAGRNVELSWLQDLTTKTFLFNSYQESQGVLNPSFSLGGAAGDTINTQVGSLSGALIAKHVYGFYYEDLTQDQGTNGSGTGVGNVRLSFGSSILPDGLAPVFPVDDNGGNTGNNGGNTATVPLPSTILAGGALLSAFGISIFVRRHFFPQMA